MLVRETPHAVPWVTAHDYSDALMYPKGYGYKLSFKRLRALLFSDDKAPRRNASVINNFPHAQEGRLGIFLEHQPHPTLARGTGYLYRLALTQVVGRGLGQQHFREVPHPRRKGQEKSINGLKAARFPSRF